MNEFLNYLEMAAFHILDLDGLDHLLFVASVVLAYTLSAWKDVLVLLTSFTLGHAISLLIMATGAIRIEEEFIEFLIPLTILVTAIIHLFAGRQRGYKMYILALIFGLIHGTAFAQGWESMFGFSAEYFKATIGFNIGIELAQLLFGFLILGITALLTNIRGVSVEKVRVFIFAVIITLAAQFLWNNWIW